MRKWLSISMLIAASCGVLAGCASSEEKREPESEVIMVPINETVPSTESVNVEIQTDMVTADTMVVRSDILQASAVIMQYTGYSAVSEKDAPTYVCVGTHDGIASWRTMQSRLQSLEALGILAEFHAYEGLPHGFGLGTGTVAEGWINDAATFWEAQQEL